MSNWVSTYWLSLLFVAIYAALVIRNAAIGRRHTVNQEDFYIGGRRLGGIAIGFSYFATICSTNAWVGFAGQAYVIGPVWLFFAVVNLALTYASWRWIAPRLRTQTEQLGSLTLADFIGFRYGSTLLRVITAVIVVGASVFYMIAIFRGIGLTIDAFWQTGYESAIALVLLLVVLYTAAGGFLSVVRTDIMQGGVMIVAAAFLFSSAMDAAGGSSVLVRTFNDVPPVFEAAEPALGVVVGTMFALTIKALIDPRLLSRFYGLRDAKAARVGMVTSITANLFVLAMLLPIGLLARALFPDGSMHPDTIVPTLIASRQWVHPAVAGVIFLALLAAAMSSIDSVLLVTATTFQRDIWRLARGTTALARTMREIRLLTVMFGSVTAALALNPPGGIVALTVFSGALFAACLMAPVFFGLAGRRASREAALASMLAGGATLLIASVTALSELIHPIFAATGLSILTYAVVATTISPRRH